MRKLFGISIICALLTGSFHASLGVVHKIISDLFDYPNKLSAAMSTVMPGDSVIVYDSLLNCVEPSVPSLNTQLFQEHMALLRTACTNPLDTIEIEFGSSIFPVPSSAYITNRIGREQRVARGEIEIFADEPDSLLVEEFCLFHPADAALISKFKTNPYPYFIEHYQKTFFEKNTRPKLPAIVEAIATLKDRCTKLVITVDHRVLNDVAQQELHDLLKVKNIEFKIK